MGPEVGRSVVNIHTSYTDRIYSSFAMLGTYSTGSKNQQSAGHAVLDRLDKIHKIQYAIADEATRDVLKQEPMQFHTVDIHQMTK